MTHLWRERNIRAPDVVSGELLFPSNHRQSLHIGTWSGGAVSGDGGGIGVMSENQQVAFQFSDMPSNA